MSPATVSKRFRSGETSFQARPHHSGFEHPEDVRFRTPDPGESMRAQLVNEPQVGAGEKHLGGVEFVA
jgi:hypothetical protein